ncbi:hypothetical protein FB451DRAFT_1223624 [Mycena latifolia]|nr:hypothetical protein FB451DRAFT_1223624 [Mycena latifolia]
MAPLAASGAPGRSARRMLRSSEAGTDSVEKAPGASEEARLCRADGGAAGDRRECALLVLEMRTGRARRMARKAPNRTWWGAQAIRARHRASRTRYGGARFERRGPERTYAMLDVLATRYAERVQRVVRGRVLQHLEATLRKGRAGGLKDTHFNPPPAFSARRGPASRQMRGLEWDWESRFQVRGIAGRVVERRLRKPEPSEYRKASGGRSSCAVRSEGKHWLTR